MTNRKNQTIAQSTINTELSSSLRMSDSGFSSSRFICSEAYEPPRRERYWPSTIEQHRD
jgi:hypothetical protein